MAPSALRAPWKGRRAALREVGATAGVVATAAAAVALVAATTATGVGPVLPGPDQTERARVQPDGPRPGDGEYSILAPSPFVITTPAGVRMLVGTHLPVTGVPRSGNFARAVARATVPARPRIPAQPGGEATLLAAPQPDASRSLTDLDGALLHVAAHDGDFASTLDDTVVVQSSLAPPSRAERRTDGTATRTYERKPRGERDERDGRPSARRGHHGGQGAGRAAVTPAPGGRARR